MDRDNRTGKKGFAGLDSMVSDVKMPRPSTPQPIHKDEPEANPEPITSGSQPAYTGNPSSGGSSGKWWAIGVGLVVFFIWIGSSDKHTSSEVAPAPAPEAAAPAPAPAAWEPAPAPEAAAPAPAPEAAAPAPAPATNYKPAPPDTSGDEERPPVGSGLVFNRSQIRYCLSEKARISAWQSQVDEYSETSVNAFNEAVNDYNSRCSHFRYRSGAVESVQSELDAISYTLRLEGMARARANP